MRKKFPDKSPCWKASMPAFQQADLSRKYLLFFPVHTSKYNLSRRKLARVDDALRPDPLHPSRQPDQQRERGGESGGARGPGLAGEAGTSAGPRLCNHVATSGRKVGHSAPRVPKFRRQPRVEPRPAAVEICAHIRPRADDRRPERTADQDVAPGGGSRVECCWYPW